MITTPTVGSSTGFTATQKYYYDSLNRIDDATETISSTQTWRQDFTYDRYGNRRFNETNTSMPASFSNQALTNPTISTTNNRLTSTGWTYDASGNTTGDPQSQTFIYDGENKQVEVKNSSSATIGQYAYDGDGRRVKKYKKRVRHRDSSNKGKVSITAISPTRSNARNITTSCAYDRLNRVTQRSYAMPSPTPSPSQYQNSPTVNY